jgi:hypothetical protein
MIGSCLLVPRRSAQMERGRPVFRQHRTDFCADDSGFSLSRNLCFYGMMSGGALVIRVEVPKKRSAESACLQMLQLLELKRDQAGMGLFPPVKSLRQYPFCGWPQRLSSRVPVAETYSHLLLGKLRF